MNAINRLSELLNKFPGIGPRQAKRFVYFLLTTRPEYRNELGDLIKAIQNDVAVCPACFRYFTKNGSPLCNVCGDRNRSLETLMVVEKDVDVDALEKSGVYQGKYFVLGGVITALEKHPEEVIRVRELEKTIGERMKSGLNEVILALSATADGDETREYLEKRFKPLTEKKLKISSLGRGLSTGSELEYADPSTLKSAFQNRR